jgi:hypothetical protein
MCVRRLNLRYEIEITKASVLGPDLDPRLSEYEAGNLDVSNEQYRDRTFQPKYSSNIPIPSEINYVCLYVYTS